LLDDGKNIEIGTPILNGAAVEAKILKQGKGKKVIAYKYKAKSATTKNWPSPAFYRNRDYPN